MIKTFKINTAFLFLYFLVVLLLLLTDHRFGRGMAFFLRFVLCLPFVSILFTVHSFFTLKLSEFFPESLLLRKNLLTYTIHLKNRGFLPSCLIAVVYSEKQGLFKSSVKEEKVFLLPRKEKTLKISIACNKRGEYYAGIDTIILSDPFSIFAVTIKQYKKKIIVLPQIYTIEQRDFSYSDINIQTYEDQYNLTFHDNTFKGLKDYQQNMPLESIAWKRFAQLGEPKILEYSKLSGSDFLLILDARRLERCSDALLLKEDLSIELFLSLAKFFLDSRQSVNLMLSDNTILPCKNMEQLYDLRRELAFFQFSEFSGELDFMQIRSGLIVTHNFDHKILDLIYQNSSAFKIAIDSQLLSDWDKAKIEKTQSSSKRIFCFKQHEDNLEQEEQ